MNSNANPGAYDVLRRFIESLSGTMTYQPGGGPGGLWEIILHGKTARIEVRGDHINELDRLYVPKIPNPKSGDDFESPGELVEGVFWKLVHLVEYFDLR